MPIVTPQIYRENMIFSSLPVLIMIGVAAAFAFGLLFLTSIMGPRVNQSTKSEAYECGVPSTNTSQGRSQVKFYRVAILFLLFDVEAAFLFPWAIIYKKSLKDWGGWFTLSELAVFLLILLVGYLYAWKRGALEWD